MVLELLLEELKQMLIEVLQLFRLARRVVLALQGIDILVGAEKRTIFDMLLDRFEVQLIELQRISGVFAG